MLWPFILGSLAVSAVGVVQRNRYWLYAGAVLSLAFAWYLSSWRAPVGPLGLLLPMLHLFGAVAVYRGKPVLAWALLIPHAALALWLAVLVLSQ
jgi:hypothetical protein